MGMSVVDEAVAEERFRRIYAAYERQVCAYCLRCIDGDQAIDCTAETFLVACRRISDVPAGDIGVGGREIGFMFGQYNGLHEKGMTLIGDLRWQDFAGDSYWRADVSNLGLDTREGSVTWGSNRIRVQLGFDSQLQVRNDSGRSPLRGGSDLTLPAEWVSASTTGGFTAFIPWTFQDEGTSLQGEIEGSGGYDYLRTLAISRLALDNVDHVQGSWVTQGLKIGQVSLFFGADDLGSIMLEENVVSAAGTERTRMDAAEIRRQIRQAGFRPAQRDTRYRTCDHIRLRSLCQLLPMGS